MKGLTIYRRNGVEAFTDLATLREVSKEAELPRDVVATIEKMRSEPGQTHDGARSSSGPSRRSAPRRRSRRATA